jgi:hypothetical protein
MIVHMPGSHARRTYANVASTVAQAAAAATTSTIVMPMAGVRLQKRRTSADTATTDGFTVVTVSNAPPFFTCHTCFCKTQPFGDDFQRATVLQYCNINTRVLEYVHVNVHVYIVLVPAGSVVSW